MKRVNLDIPFILIHVFIIVFLVQYFVTINYTKLINFEDCIIPFIVFPAIIGGVIKYIVPRLSLVICYFIGFCIQWILFLNVNPYPISIDNKLEVMEKVPIKFRPEVQYSFSEIGNKKITYPIVIKPVFCSGDGHNVRIIKSESDLNNVMNQITDPSEYMVQNYLADYNVEVGVLYERMPWEKTGRVIEITEKTNSDEVKNWEENNIINQSSIINNSIHRIFNNISKKVPGLNVGRYDIRLHSIQDLEKGDFKIVEINGTMGMHLYLSEVDDLLKSTMEYFMIDMRWHFYRIIIGLSNIVLLRGYSPWNLLIAMFKSCKSMMDCRVWENLYSLYS
jgi:hypothetical protein